MGVADDEAGVGLLDGPGRGTHLSRLRAALVLDGGAREAGTQRGRPRPRT